VMIVCTSFLLWLDRVIAQRDEWKGCSYLSPRNAKGNTSPSGLRLHISFPIHALCQPNLYALNNLLLSLVPHRVPSPDLRLWSSGYVATRWRRVLFAEKLPTSKRGALEWLASDRHPRLPNEEKNERAETRDESDERGTFVEIVKSRWAASSAGRRGFEDALRVSTVLEYNSLSSRHAKREAFQSNNKTFLTVYDRMMTREHGCGEVAPAINYSKLFIHGQLAMQVASIVIFLSTVISVPLNTSLTSNYLVVKRMVWVLR
jgi:hypothetical protein